MTTGATPYAARLEIDYPQELDWFSTFFRILLAIPILIVISLITATGSHTVEVLDDAGRTVEVITRSGGGIVGGLWMATALMIAFRQKYPRWWFDFQRELARFSTRVGAYLSLLTDTYPSTTDEQAVHLELDYPDAEQLDRVLPLVKWLLIIPHLVVLAFLTLGAVVAMVIAWFAILFTGRYPRALFDYVTGVFRWWLRVEAYAFFLVTDRYPPFSLR